MNHVFVVLCVPENAVVISRQAVFGVGLESFGVELIASDGFVAEVFRAEDGVHYHFQVVGGGEVAVEVDAAGFFQQPLAFDQAGRHHHQVGEHRAAVMA